jgi:hypothetical protein
MRSKDSARIGYRNVRCGYIFCTSKALALGLVACVFLLFWSWSPVAYGHEVRLRWEPSPEIDVAGYFLYLGQAPGEYPSHLVVGTDACDTRVCQISVDLPDGPWYFAATAFDEEGAESDFSEEIHATLGSGQPNLLYPNGTVTWIRGCSYEIAWENMSGSTVSLDVMKAGRVYRKITSSTQNDGVHLLAVDKKQATGEFQVRVSSGGLSDQSDEPFRIVDPVVLTPAMRATLQRGSTFEVSWERETFCGTQVAITLYKGRAKALTIASAAPNTGTFQWSIPQTLSSAGTYRLLIGSATSTTCSAYSPGYFTIK